MKKALVILGLILAAGTGLYAQSLSISIHVPELGRSVSYTAYQNGRAAEDQVKGLKDKAAKGNGTIEDISSELSAAIKKYMRDRGIRLMTCDDPEYAIIRSTNPESFALVTSNPLIFPGDLPLDYGFDPDDFDLGLPPPLPPGF